MDSVRVRGQTVWKISNYTQNKYIPVEQLGRGSYVTRIGSHVTRRPYYLSCGVERLHLDSSSVDHIHDIIDSNGRLCNVSGKDDLADTHGGAEWGGGGSVGGGECVWNDSTVRQET